MTVMLKGISSMATRQFLGELASAWEQREGGTVVLESVGGVDAAKRVQAGESFDFVVLASDALEKLTAAGHVVQGSRVDLAHSGVGIAVRTGAPRPDTRTEEGLKAAVLAAPSIGYSTGPSGTALLKLFERWGVTQELQGRLKQARPGVPVGSMIATGEVDLGFQQLSELIHLQGIDVVGPMPAAVEILTTFSGGVCSVSSQAGTARAMLAFMASVEAAEAKRRNGMDPA